jgi:LPXTG-motif cell wall-anchored protein
MTAPRILPLLARLVLTAVVAMVVLGSGVGDTYAQGAPDPSNTKVEFRVVATTTTAPPASTTTTEPVATASSGHRSSGGSLPLTGGSFLQLALIAGALSAAGSLLVALTRRRRTSGPA